MPQQIVSPPKQDLSKIFTATKRPSAGELQSIFRKTKPQEQRVVAKPVVKAGETPAQDTAKQISISGGVQPITPKQVGQVYTDVAVRPGAAARSFLQGQGYTKGAIEPEKVPYFQDIAVDNYYQSTDNMLRQIKNPTMNNLVRSARDTAGLGVSAVGYVADMATNPFDLLTEVATLGTAKALKGLKPRDANKMVQIIKHSDDLKRDKKFMDTVVDGLTKAIRPTKTGKKSFGKIQKFNSNAALAVDSILENSDNIRYIDKAGDVVGQGKPKTLGEMSQAIEQTKETLFKEYQAMQKAAGDKETVIVFDDIVNSLLDSISGRESQVFAEDTGKVFQLASRLDEMKYATLDEADNMVKMFNEDLKSFYRGTSTSGIPKQKAMAAKMIRDKMDDAITKSGVAGRQEYRDLRRRYGALVDLEKDTAGRFIVAGRANPRGFFDLSDVFSGGAIIEGLVSLNPSKIAKGVGMGTIKQSIKYMNSPNRLVSQTFKAAENIKYAKPGVFSSVKVPISKATVPAIGTVRQTAEKLIQ